MFSFALTRPSSPTFSFSVCRFLSLSPFLSVRKVPSHLGRKGKSAFIDRSRNDLAHVSYSSWRSGVGRLDFPSPSLRIESQFSLFFLATRCDATQLGADSIPRRDVPSCSALALAVVDSHARARLSLTSFSACCRRAGETSSRSRIVISPAIDSD